MKKILVYALSLMLAIMSLSCGALAEATWNCTNCGKKDISSKFCSECGAARPAQDWICPSCGRTNQKLFCPDCGTNRDAAQQQSTLMPLETLRPDDDAGMQTADAQAADVQTDDAQPDDVQEPADPLLTLDDLMIPNRLIDLMNACIAITCDQVATEMSEDPEQLLDACLLTDSWISTYFFSFSNPEVTVEMYFYYPGVETPDPETESSQWCIAVEGTDDYSYVMRSLVFSATLTLLKQMDPELDEEAAVDLMMQEIPGSQYFGNGYTLTYLVTDGGNSTQVMVQKS